MEIWQIVPAAYALVAAAIFIFISLKPRYFWLFFVIITVGTAGLIMIPVQPYSVALVDELLAAAAAAGAIMALMSGAVKVVKKPNTLLGNIHWALFLILGVYLLLQSIRGYYLWGNILLLRWVCFYVLVIAAAFLTSNTDLPRPKRPELIRVILWSWLVYLVAYLAHGFYTQYVLGISYYSLSVQGVQWTGSNYALFPMVIAIPAAFFYLRKGLGIRQWLAWVVIALTLVAGHVYDSRAVFAGVAIFSVAALTVLGLRKTLPVALAGGLAVFIFYWRTLADFLGNMAQTLTLQYSGDAGRWAIMHAAINAIGQNAGTLLFGYGINSHHYVLGPFMKEAGHPTIANAPDYSQVTMIKQTLTYNFAGGVPDYVRVTGFGSMLTDIGLVGAFLLAAVFLVLILRLLLMARSAGKFMMVVSLLLILAWMMFSKIEDILLIWFVLMPSGIALALAQDDGEPAAAKAATP